MDGNLGAAAWELADVVGATQAQPVRDHDATVSHVDADGTTWVTLAGAEEATPVASTLADVKPGQTVRVHVEGGRASIMGNKSAPATSAARVAEVVAPVSEVASAAAATAVHADGIAKEAQEVANATGQHFFTDANGIHVTEAEGDPATGHNILINSLGILLRKALNPLVSITQSAIAFYDGAGSAAANVVASFGASGAQIGKASSAHVNVTSTGMEMYAKNGSTLNKVVEVGYDIVGTDTLATVNIGTNGGADGALIKVGGLDIKALTGGIQISSQRSGTRSTLYVDNIDAGGLSLRTALPTTSGGTGSKAYGSILTEDVSTAVSVGTSAWTTLGSVDLAAGDWIVSYNTYFATNGTGRRAMVLNSASGAASAANLRQGGVQEMAVTGGGTYMNACRVLHLTSAATYYLNVYQTSGAALSVYGYIRAYRLK